MTKFSYGRKDMMETELKQRLKMYRKRNPSKWKFLYIKRYAVAPRINEYSLHACASRPTANNIVKIEKI